MFVEFFGNKISFVYDCNVTWHACIRIVRLQVVSHIRAPSVYVDDKAEPFSLSSREALIRWRE